MAKRWLRRGGLVVAGLLLGVGAAEIAARLRTPEAAADLLFSAPESMPQDMYQDDRDLIQVSRPGFRATVSTYDYEVPIRINSLGLRGEEPSAEEHRAEGHWLALGDSFTMAVQVPEEETYVAVLGEKMKVDVLNAGVDGYSTWQATGRYLRLDDKVNASRVILMFFLGNDLTDNQIFHTRLAEAQRGAMLKPQSRSADPFARFLSSHSALYAYWRIAQKRANIAAGRDRDGERFRAELTIFSEAGRGVIDNLVPRTRDALAQLQAETGKRGDKLLVAVAPPAFAIDPVAATATLAEFGLAQPKVDAPRLLVLDILKTLGIAACDLTPPLTAADASGVEPYFHYDGHWTAAGHRVVADALAGCLGGAG